MAAITGTNGELRYAGQRVAKCRNFSIDINRDALETTSLGETDRTYTKGIRGATGSATILYDEENQTTIDMLNSIFDDTSSADSISMVLNTSTNKTFACSALLTQVGTPVSVGEVTACSVNFQITGPIDGTF